LRISHISQLGLFLFTVGTIYFTVIPLYQKALLDEQIAQKQIELKRMQVSLDAAYSKIRLSALHDFIFQAGAECSGLLVPIPPLQKFGQPRPTSSRAQLVLAISPGACLTGMINSTKALRELRSDDLAALKVAVHKTSTDLETKRQAALSRFSRAELTVDSDPSRSDPASVEPGTVADFVFKGETAQWQHDVLRGAAIDKERSDAADAYGSQVRSEMSELWKIRWGNRRPESDL
jgi:hypothetical protein